MTNTHEQSLVPFLDLGAMQADVVEEVDAAWRRVTRDTAYIGGEAVEQFEVDWAAYCERRHAVGVGNGTDALTLALRALGIGAGDEVVLPANTFVATAEAVVLAGAVPRFVDVDADTLLLDADEVRSSITPRTAAVIVVHLYGQVPDMDAIAAVTRQAGVALIEDAAQAHGATWRGRKAGSFGAVGCFSFYPGKNLGAFGDAGAVVTNDAGLAATIRSLGNHGRALHSKHEHPLAGVNSRLDALQAAVLSAKLSRLEAWNKGRREAAALYRSLLDINPAVRLVRTLPECDGVYHLNVVQVNDRDGVRGALTRHGIQTGVHYPVPCHEQPPYAPYADTPLPTVERVAGRIVSLPMFPHITDQQVARVCEGLAQVTR